MRLQSLLPLALISSLAVLGLSACAEDDAASKVSTIGILHPGKVDMETARGFKEEMAALGYVEGQNMRYVHDGPAGRGEGLVQALDKMQAEKVDLIFSASTPATKAAQKATHQSRTPVVFGPVNDPIRAGLMTDLQKPGGNITGVTLPRSAGLRLEWLAKTAPGVRRILAIYNGNDPSAAATLAQAAAALGKLEVTLQHAPVINDEEISATLADVPADIDALFLARDSMLTSRIEDVVATSLRLGLPLSVPGYIQVRAGALTSYGFYHYEVGRNAARLADQILRGAPPGSLPVETAESFLFFNQKTAARIGLEIPVDLLRQAKEVIR